MAFNSTFIFICRMPIHVVLFKSEDKSRLISVDSVRNVTFVFFKNIIECIFQCFELRNATYNFDWFKTSYFDNSVILYRFNSVVTSLGHNTHTFSDHLVEIGLV